MHLRTSHLLLSLSLLGQGFAATAPLDSDPIVKLPYGSFRGKVIGNITQFLGMPFASPPVGNRRFALPEPPIPFKGIQNATSYGIACPQQILSVPVSGFPAIPPTVNTSEDCLTINVLRPTNIKKGTLLPVIVYIYGGGFEIGDTSQYPGDSVLNRSFTLGEPVLYVSANHRIGAFGFLGGKEVKAAGIGNAGLHDQRFALQWVQDHIKLFGGDPKRTTIWGESAGAISVGLQMVLNNGNTNGLFSGAIMQSGSPTVLPDILHRQNWFDFLVDNTNCTAAADRLKCLRGVPYAELVAAVNKTPNIFSYQSVTLTWQPMVDGKLIVRDPLISLQTGRYSKVPFITGDAEDEGTLFSYSTLNITTNEQFLGHIKSNYFPSISATELQALAAAYPEDVTQGSPFNSGTVNAITPQFKRLAALQGDLAFQAPRRFFLEIASKTQQTFAFRYTRGASTPGYGAAHGSDLEEFFGLGNNSDFIGLDSVLYFSNKRDPNAPKNSISLLSNITWDKWSSSATNPPLLTFVDPAPSVNITYDTYRKDAIKLVNKLSLRDIGIGL